MLKRLHLKNFTVFADADFEFVQGLNVLVGTNGTGKSHVLKMGYAAVKTAVRFEPIDGFKLAWVESNISNYAREELARIFLPQLNNISQLIRWQTSQTEAVIEAEFGRMGSSTFKVGIPKTEVAEYSARVEGMSEQYTPNSIDRPVFIPAKEVLTLSWISRLDERYKLPIDGTHLDLLAQLRSLALKSISGPSFEVLSSLERIIGGAVEMAGETFYFVLKQGKKVESNLIAEGIRKFGILSQLLANGSLTKNATLFWDEPEANLNPALLRKLANILTELASQGFQIILATHSTDLLKEFHILSRQKSAKKFQIKYFGLNAGPGEAVRVVSTDNFEYLPDVVALEVELEQADELDAIFAREDRERHADL